MPALLPLGRLVATANAAAHLNEADIHIAISRHQSGDWADVDGHDRTENDLSLKKGFRLLSVYYGQNKVKFWIITESDRSVTTALLPEDCRRSLPRIELGSFCLGNFRKWGTGSPPIAPRGAGCARLLTAICGNRSRIEIV